MTDHDPYNAREPAAARKPRPATAVGLKAIRAHFEDAARRLEDEQRLPDDPDPNRKRGGIGPGHWEGYPHDRMPPDCPVRVIGRDEGGNVYVITATHDLRMVDKWDMPTIIGIFAPAPNYAYWAWPGWSKKKEKTDPDTGEVTIIPPRVDRIERDKLAACLINQAAKLPLFDPQQQHRGRGGWQDRHERFVWHSGTWLWVSEKDRLQRARPMDHDGFLYTRQASTIEPWATPIGAGESPALRILKDLRTWKWERPYLDPVLVLGWIATAIMGGALKARPIIFTTGGAGVGKSTLHELLKKVLDRIVVTAVDTTAAGIYQRVKRDSLPVMIDELESKPGSTKASNVIELARVAYTGGDISRGGQDHEGTTFRVHNSFFLSAINQPPMGTQDKTRMAVLNLRRLNQADGAPPIDVDPEHDGRMLLRQVMDGWSEFRTRILPDYETVLRGHRLDSRAIDTYGTLLAAAELLVGPEALEEIGLPVTDAGRLGEIIADATAFERAEQLDNWHRCLNHLLQSTIEAWKGGEKPIVGAVLEEAMNDTQLDIKYARERLAAINCGLVERGKVAEGMCLAIPRDGPALKRLYADTDWHRSVWFDALKQAPEGIVIRDRGNQQKVRIAGTVSHCLLVDLKAFEAYVAKGEK